MTSAIGLAARSTPPAGTRRPAPGRWVACALAALLLPAGCGETDPGDAAGRSAGTPPSDRAPATAAEAPTLYRRLGGEVVIGLVVQNVIQRMAADEELSEAARRSFEGDRREVAPVMRRLTEQIASAAGSREHPSAGITLRDSLAELGVEGADYQRFLAHLEDALSALDVPDADRAALLERVAP